MNEVWKPIPGYEGLYEASSIGQIRSVDRTVLTYSARAGRTAPMRRKGKLLSLNVGPHGYMLACLSKNGKAKTQRVNRLVCSAFHGERHSSVLACHNDGDRKNNMADNLRWDCAKGNQEDRKRHGTHLCGEAVGNSVLTTEDVAAIRASKTYGKLVGVSVSRTHYHRIKKGEAWSHISSTFARARHACPCVGQTA